MRKLAIALAGAFLVAAVAAPASASEPMPNTEPEVGADGHKVVVCHATSSYSNPYVVITVDVASSGLKKVTAHYDHATAPNKKGWMDVIPAFTYGDFTFDGMGEFPANALELFGDDWLPPAECVGEPQDPGEF